MRWWHLSFVVAAVAACGGETHETLLGDDAGANTRDVARADVVTATRDVVTATPDVVTAPADVISAPADVVTAPPPDADDLTPDLTPDGGATMDVVEMPAPTMGATMRVTATSLNLRSGVGTTNAILTSMPCGAQVTVLGGPTSGWWNIRYMSTTGWASGAYLTPESSFDASVCGGTTTPPVDAGTTAPGTPVEVAQIFALARPAVGYSYYWGHGSWGTDGTNHGSCSGNCPSCTHSGRYGADCSGFVAKVWQIPGASAVTTDAHPYSTYNFYNEHTHWSRVSRDAMRPGDALVYNASGSGHIVLFESGSDPWGSLWVYEARGCATGIVHNLRAIGSTFVAIRREGL